MTLRGLFGAFRVGVLERASFTLVPGQDLPSLLASWTGTATKLWTAGLGFDLGAIPA